MGIFSAKLVIIIHQQQGVSPPYNNQIYYFINYETGKKGEKNEQLFS
jgi:hypothetical protein